MVNFEGNLVDEERLVVECVGHIWLADRLSGSQVPQTDGNDWLFHSLWTIHCIHSFNNVSCPYVVAIHILLVQYYLIDTYFATNHIFGAFCDPSCGNHAVITHTLRSPRRSMGYDSFDCIIILHQHTIDCRPTRPSPLALTVTCVTTVMFKFRVWKFTNKDLLVNNVNICFLVGKDMLDLWILCRQQEYKYIRCRLAISQCGRREVILIMAKRLSRLLSTS